MEENMRRAVRFLAFLSVCLVSLVSCNLFNRVPLIWLNPKVEVFYTGGEAGGSISFLAQVDSNPYSPTQENSFLGNTEEGVLSYKFTATGASALNLTLNQPLPASFGGADVWGGEKGSYASTGIPVTVDASSNATAGDVILLQFRVDVDLKYSEIAGGGWTTNTVHQFVAR
jgi:hypothetical protein